MYVRVPPDAVVLAMDVHKNSITTGLLKPGWDSPVLDKISTDDESVRRLINRFEVPQRVWACYEAGPTGYGLARRLRSAGMTCEVIAPSLIPTRSGDRVKTDKRDARRLARLFRAGPVADLAADGEGLRPTSILTTPITPETATSETRPGPPIRASSEAKLPSTTSHRQRRPWLVGPNGDLSRHRTTDF